MIDLERAQQTASSGGGGGLQGVGSRVWHRGGIAPIQKSHHHVLAAQQAANELQRRSSMVQEVNQSIYELDPDSVGKGGGGSAQGLHFSKKGFAILENEGEGVSHGGLYLILYSSTRELSSRRDLRKIS